MRKRGFTLVDVAMLCVIAALLAAFLCRPTLFPNKERSCGPRCQNNLKQIGLAAIQYSDDKRYFPHLGPRHQLDGGFDTGTSARCLRNLIYFNYDDNPESFVCPASPDRFGALSPAAKADIRAFAWRDGDQTLGAMTDLSYGWTKRAANTNSPSSWILAGDKARALAPDDPGPRTKHAGNAIGNHPDCLLVVAVDAHVERITPRRDTLVTANSIAATTKSAAGEPGFLGVLQDDEQNSD